MLSDAFLYFSILKSENIGAISQLAARKLFKMCEPLMRIGKNGAGEEASTAVSEDVSLLAA